MAKACKEVAQAWMRIMRDTENDLPPERAPILDLTAGGAIANDQPFFYDSSKRASFFCCPASEIWFKTSK
jgi:hypothetical protein